MRFARASIALISPLIPITPGAVTVPIAPVMIVPTGQSPVKGVPTDLRRQDSRGIKDQRLCALLQPRARGPGL